MPWSMRAPIVLTRLLPLTTLAGPSAMAMQGGPSGSSNAMVAVEAGARSRCTPLACFCRNRSRRSPLNVRVVGFDLQVCL